MSVCERERESKPESVNKSERDGGGKVETTDYDSVSSLCKSKL